MRTPHRRAASAAKTDPEQRPPRLRLRIVKLFSPYRRHMTLLVLTVIGQSAATIASPFLLRDILDKALPERNMTLLTWLALGMGGAAVIAALLTVASTWLSNFIGQRIMHDVRLSVYTHLQRMSFAFFTRTRTGEIQSTIANDIGAVNNVITNTAASAVQSIATIAAVSVAIFLLDWQLALLSLAVVPLFFLLTFRLGAQRRQIVRGRQRRLAHLTSMVEETMSVAGVLLIKTMNRAERLRAQFSEESSAISDLEIQASMAGRWRTASRRMSMTVIPAAVYWIAGESFIHGADATSIGTLVAFTSMLNRVIGPAGDLQGLGLDVSTSLAIFARIFTVLDQPADITERPGAGELAVDKGTVTLQDVRFRYDPDGPWTLSGVSATIPGCSTAAIVGQTGAGKTTLAYLIARLYEPESGSVLIDGTDVRDVTFSSLADAVGFVSQETYMFHTSIGENLRFARPDATDEEIEKAARAARIHDLIASLPKGYDTVVGERGYRFSGGERQRMAIARLLLRDPRIVILDEATSALDTETERAVQDAIAELTRERTTIAIAHRLSTVRNADQILVVDGGTIIERGTHEELLALDGRYARLVGAAAGDVI